MWYRSQIITKTIILILLCIFFEQDLRARIGAAGYNTMIYTGTFGISQLRNQNNQLVNIFLHRDSNNNPQLPVPLYFYKVGFELMLLMTSQNGMKVIKTNGFN